MAPSLRWLALVALIVTAPAFAADRPREIADALAVQEAVRSGRELIIRGEYAKAVDILEKQLDRTHGDPTFLATLREAYVGYLKDLQLGGKVESVEVYRQRLAILEKSSKPATPPMSPTPPATVVKQPEAPRGSVVRGVRPDDDPFQQVPLADREAGHDLLVQAEQAFGSQHYDEAADFFSRASKSGPSLSSAQQSQWAYCLLNDVVTRMNSANPPTVGALENEVRSALAMAPKDSELEKFGNKLLGELSAQNNSGIPVPSGSIKHTAATDGWAKAESANFRLYHNQPREAAEQIVKLAEQHRAAAFAKWATTNPPAWKPICELYLYANGADYAKVTGQNPTSPGHSTIKAQNGRVMSRRMDLRVDDSNFLGCVLPHETTHVVLGDLFADAPLPRWADEGMAVLAEPRSQVERYSRTLIRRREAGQLIHLGQLVSQTEYPSASMVTVFYIESVSVVEFLVNMKGPAEFVKFMHDASRGFDAALAKHYGFRSTADLEDRWLRATFTEVDRLAGR
ncbi:MAG: hypothetical protein ACJ8C4_04540 [Gemmataceae bacterium]